MRRCLLLIATAAACSSTEMGAPDTGVLDGSAEEDGLSPRPDVLTASDAAAPDAAAPDLAPADDAAAPDAAAPTGLFVGPGGDDMAAGTMGTPLKTLRKAFSMAKPGDTITLLDGTYDAASEPALGTPSGGPCSATAGVVAAPGVNLQAMNPGKAQISVTGSHGLCLRGNTVTGVSFVHPGNGGRMVEVTEGDNVIEGATFTGAYCSGGGGGEGGVEVHAMAKLTLRPGGVANYFGGGCQFLVVTDGGQATVEGGTISGGTPGTTSGNALTVAARGGRLIFDGVTLETVMHGTGIALGGGRLVTKNKTIIRGFTSVGVLARGADNIIEMSDTTVEKTGSAGILAAAGYLTVIDATVARSTFTGVRAGISVADGSSKVAVTDSVFEQGEIGIGSGTSDSIAVTGGRFQALTGGGLQLAGLCKQVKVRGASFLDAPANAAGARIGCVAGSVVDFGTLADPGNNTFTAAMGTRLYVQAAVDLVSAVGNSWIAGEQGATAAGKYEVMGPGAVLDVAVGMGGRNYRVVQGKLRLAQNP